MVIDLRKMEDSEIGFAVLVEPSEADLGVRYSVLSKAAEFVGNVKKEGWIIRVSGSFDVEFERRCDRCYKAAILNTAVEVDAAYVVFSALNEKREAKLEILGLDYLLLERYELDLKKVFSEQLLLALPDRFVCQDGCPPICAECGMPQDSAECRCSDKSIDPRWSALGDFKKNL